MTRVQQVVLALLLLALLVGGLGAFFLANDGVLCVPAVGPRAGAPDELLPGRWRLEDEPFSNQLLVLRRDGTLRAVGLTEGLGPAAETIRVHTRDWSLDGGVLTLAGDDVGTWRVDAHVLEVGGAEHQSHFRRVWCLGE